jgi:hypothetical protein
VMEGFAERLADAIATSGHNHDFTGNLHRSAPISQCFCCAAPNLTSRSWGSMGQLMTRSSTAV